MGGACGEGRGVHRILVGKPEGKRPLGRPRRRWEDNIKMDLQEVGGGCGDWMELAQDRDRWRALLSMVMNLRVPKMWGISWLAAEPVSFSRRTLLHGVSKEGHFSLSFLFLIIWHRTCILTTIAELLLRPFWTDSQFVKSYNPIQPPWVNKHFLNSVHYHRMHVEQQYFVINAWIHVSPGMLKLCGSERACKPACVHTHVQVKGCLNAY